VFHWKGREETFGEALRGAGRIYENQAQMQIALGGMFLEPVVIFGVVGGIGFFVLSLFLPLIQLLNELS
jgi:type II secretory pathway component PulF